eukprot:12263550-Alexandrium_andersonii.AAC.1
MSASLVGSEMCIRDSVFSPPEAPADFTLLLNDVPERRLPWAVARDFDVDPVSYTHLTLPTICSV